LCIRVGGLETVNTAAYYEDTASLAGLESVLSFLDASQSMSYPLLKYVDTYRSRRTDAGSLEEYGAERFGLDAKIVELLRDDERRESCLKPLKSGNKIPRSANAAVPERRKRKKCKKRIQQEEPRRKRQTRLHGGLQWL
jgi:hypothetical protein